MVTRAPSPESKLPIENPIRRIKIPKMAETVAAELRKMIVRDELKEGDRLMSEAELMAQFGISRPTLREAIRILESESLLTVTRGSREGARIHKPDSKVAARFFGLVLQSGGTTMADLYRARSVIEPPAARIVAETARDTAPPVLRALIAQQHAVIDDETHLSQMSTQFHQKLVELAGNQTLTLVMKMLREIFERHLAAVTVAANQQVDNTDHKRKGIRSQEKLITFIEAGNGDGAEEFWRLHLKNVDKIMLRDQQFERVVDLLD